MQTVLVVVPAHRCNNHTHYCATNVSHTEPFSLRCLPDILNSVYVGYPKAARHAIRDSSLNVTSMSILDPAPDSIELTVVEKLYSKSSYHPTLYPFNASLYLLNHQEAPPFVSIQTSEIKAHNNATVTIGPQRVNITNLHEFTNFVLMTAASEQFTYALRGKGDLKQGALPRVGVNYDKNITMKGAILPSFNITANFS